MRRITLALCLLLTVQAFAQTSRLDSVRTLESGQIEIRLISEKAGDFDSEPAGAAAFKLRENGIAQESLAIEKLPALNETSRTVILADLSRSLGRRQFANFKKAALAFVDKLKPGDLVALITFHRKVYREVNFTADKELLKRKISGLRQSGNRTMLYDAVLEAHRMLADAPPRKAIMLYTDGKENASRITIADLIDLYSSHPVPLFVAGRHKSFALKRMIRLARVSGGDAFRADQPRDIAKVFRYLSRLRSQEYLLRYKTRQKPGSTVDLEVEAPGVEKNLIRSYTIPNAMATAKPVQPNAEPVALLMTLRKHMPEILLSLIVLLLIAVIIMLFFRKQEINVKVENAPPQVFIPGDELIGHGQKKNENQKAKLPLDYHHGWLVEKEGPHTGRKYRINWHVVTLGFSDDNSIVIDDNTVSARHAKIERQGKKFVLFDLMSESGTLLNGKKLLRPKELNDFDEIGLGRTRLIFRKSSGSYDKKTAEEV